MNNKTKTHKNNRGATFMEVMVAILVFGVGLEGLLNVYTQSMVMTKRADSAYTAYNLAKNHIERLKAMSFALLPSAAEPDQIPINADGDPDPDGLFLRTTTVNTGYAGNVLLTQVTVKVDYLFRGVQSGSPTQLTTVILSQ